MDEETIRRSAVLDPHDYRRCFVCDRVNPPCGFTAKMTETPGVIGLVCADCDVEMNCR